MKKIIFILFNLMLISGSVAGLELASPFQNGMVLQRDKPVNIWGWAANSTDVSVTIDGTKVTQTSDSDGKWMITFPPMQSGGPHKVVVAGGGETITLTDVLVGDVWITFGQSNMLRRLREITGSRDFINDIEQNKLPIRCLQVAQNAAISAQEKGPMTWHDNTSDVGAWSAVGTVFAYELYQETKIPTAIIWAAWGSSSIEGWMPVEMTETFPHFADIMEKFYTDDEARVVNMLTGKTAWRDVYIRTRPNILYNGMMHTLLPYTISGFVWYQGESNAGDGMSAIAQYRFTLPAFIKEYRKRFLQGDLPFLAVQLPSYDSKDWAWFREAQSLGIQIDSAYAAINIDVGDPGNVHYKGKAPVGKRLSLLARKYVYGENIEADGPVYKSMAINGDQVTIDFTHAAGLKTKNGKAPASFQLAGSDQKWHAATNSSISSTKVILSSTSVSKPVAVRYAWIPSPVTQVNLVNSAGLPAAPFRTDSWSLPGLGQKAPHSVNDSYITGSGQTLVIPPKNGVLNNDVDLNYDVLTASLVDSVSHGKLTLLPDGSFTYTPSSGYTGQDSFTYRSSDANSSSPVATVNIEITDRQVSISDIGRNSAAAVITQTNLGTIVMQDQTISLFHDGADKAIAFGVNDIKTSLAKVGYIVSINELSELEERSTNTSIIIATDEDNTVLSKLSSLGVKQPGPEDQGYNTYVTVSGGKTTYWVIGGDRIGAMYGAFHVAETINFESLSAVKNSTNTPHYERRGFKMNIPLDARTPAYSDVGDAFQENISEIWESSFWEEYLDEMARQRYNLIVLFSMHPFPSLVKLDKYPNVALNDVMTADIDWKRKSETMRLSGRDALDNNILNNLVVVKRMTIEEKIAFWRHVMQYAHDRGVKLHIVTWNIHVWGADGKHGITESLESSTTKAYSRESVRQLINTYPLLAGVGVTAGENMRKKSPDEKERWLFETYGQGILDALKDNPQRQIEFHHRHWWTEIKDILGHFQPVIDAGVRFDFSFKNSVAHMYSYHDPDIADPVFNELPPGYRMYNDLRNNDIYQLRWGDPDYARDYITHLSGKDKSPGLFIGTDGFLFARETVYKNSSARRELDFKRNWYKNMIWGQLAYDPTLPNSWFQKAIAAKFSLKDSETMFKAWQASSKIIPAINRFHWRDHSFQWYPEACNFRANKFSSVDHFISHPTMRMLDIYRIDQYCDRKIKSQPMKKETPVEYYTLLTKHASDALSFANSIQTSSSTELAGTVADIKAVANLGHYYGYKIQGAINLCMYDKTKEASFKNDAISNLETAYEYWNLYNNNRKLRYRDKILLARIGMVDYDWITEKVAEDIDIAKNR